LPTAFLNSKKAVALRMEKKVLHTLAIYCFIFVIVISITTIASIGEEYDSRSISRIKISQRIETLKDRITKLKHFHRANRYWQRRKGSDSINIANLKHDFLELYSQGLGTDKSLISKNSLGIEWMPIGPTSFSDSLTFLGHGRINRMLIDPKDPDVWYVLSGSGGLWITRDNGSTWEEKILGDEVVIGQSAIRSNPANPDHIVVSSGDSDGLILSGGFTSGIYQTFDRGVTWSLAVDFFSLEENIIISDLEFSQTGDTLLLAGNNGLSLFVLNEATNEWKYNKKVAFNGNSADDFKQLLYVEETDTYYASSLGYFGVAALLRSRGGLDNFEVIAEYPDALRIAMDYSIADPDYVYILASASEDENFLFLKKISLFSDVETDIKVPIGREILLSQTGYNLSLSVSRQDKDKIYIGGVLAAGSSDGGMTWDTIARNIHVDHHMFYYDDTRGRIFSCNDGGIYSQIEGESTWDNHSNGLNITQFYSLNQSLYHPEFILGSSQDNGTIRYLLGDNKHIVGRDGMDAIISDSVPDHLTVLTQGGVMGHSGDGGESVDLYKIQNPVYYPFLGSLVPKTGSDSYLYGASELLEIPWGDSTGVQLTNFGNIRMINAFDISPIDNQKLCVVKHDTLYTTNNGFQTFAKHVLPQTEVSDIQFIGVNHDSLLITFGLYNESNRVVIFSDGIFHDIGTGLPQLPINAAVSLGSPYPIMVASDLGLHYKESDAHDWVIANGNIPYSVVTDIEFSPVHGYLTVSTFGRGIWRAQYSGIDNMGLKFDPNEMIICYDSLFNINLFEHLGSSFPIVSSETIWNDGYKGGERELDKAGRYWATGPMATGLVRNFFTDIFLLEEHPEPEFYIGVANDENEDLILCEGDSLIAFIYSPEKPGWENETYWNTGEISTFISVKAQGEYYASSRDLNGCEGFSDTIFVEVLRPISIKLDTLNNLLTAPDAESYLWYLNGVLQESESRSITMSEQGEYYAYFTTQDGCTFKTESFLYSPEPEEPLIFYSQDENTIYFENMPLETKISLYDLTGKLAAQTIVDNKDNRSSLTVANLATGYYFIIVEGVVNLSSSLFIAR